MCSHYIQNDLGKEQDINKLLSLVIFAQSVLIIGPKSGIGILISNSDLMFFLHLVIILLPAKGVTHSREDWQTRMKSVKLRWIMTVIL